MYSNRRFHANDSNQQVGRALRLLELLSSVEGTIISAEEARSVLGATDAELDESIELISTLADRRSGSRAICFRDHDDIVLQGTASSLLPLRLSASEGAVLGHLLNVLDVPSDARDRMMNALVPPAFVDSVEPSLGTTVLYGTLFLRIHEAMERRCRIAVLYRSQSDKDARGRTLEPIGMSTADGVLYLTAHDVEHPGTRTYRLDRMVDVQLTDEPSERAPESSQATFTTSFTSDNAEIVLIQTDDETKLPQWDGIISRRLDPALHIVQARLYVSSHPWLFDQLLAAGGSMRIVEPSYLVEELQRYAEDLLRSS